MTSEREKLLAPLSMLKPSGMASLDYSLQLFGSERRSRMLGSFIAREILTLSQPRYLVTVGHLYLDYLLSLICRREGLEREGQRGSSFARRVAGLSKTGLLSTEHGQALLAINELRNAFAHDVFFDFATWDPHRIPFIQSVIRVPRRLDLKRAFATLAVRLSMIVLVVELEHAHRWLMLEDVPRHAMRRTKPTPAADG